MPDIYLDDLRFRDWWAFYKLATHPHFFYRALNDRSAWVAWRVTRYIIKAKLAQHFVFMRRRAKAIRSAEGRQLLGVVVMVDLHKEIYGRAEIGMFVSVPSQRRGIATTALLRFVDWCLDTYDLQSIVGTVHPENTASVKLQERLGMQKTNYIDADKRMYFSREGKAEPRIVMSASRGDIESALQNARRSGLYSCDIPVL